MGKLTISMAIFNSYVKLPEGISHHLDLQAPLSSHRAAFLDPLMPPTACALLGATQTCRNKGGKQRMHSEETTIFNGLD